MSEIVVGGVALPSPTEISINDEVVWSASTGRSASGLMTGDVVTQKKTYGIKWGILTKSDYELILSKLPPGFFGVNILGSSMSVYRSAIPCSILGTLSDGITYVKDVSVTLIQQ